MDEAKGRNIIEVAKFLFSISGTEGQFIIPNEVFLAFLYQSLCEQKSFPIDTTNLPIHQSESIHNLHNEKSYYYAYPHLISTQTKTEIISKLKKLNEELILKGISQVDMHEKPADLYVQKLLDAATSTSFFLQLLAAREQLAFIPTPQTNKNLSSHPGKLLEVGTYAAFIDEDIYSTMKVLWSLGLSTGNSCQNFSGKGTAGIVFNSLSGLRWLEKYVYSGDLPGVVAIGASPYDKDVVASWKWPVEKTSSIERDLHRLFSQDYDLVG